MVTSFQHATRQNITNRGRADYSSGGQSSIALPEVGYLARIHVLFSGVMNVVPGTGTAVISERAPWNLLRRLRFEAGSGTAIFNTSGWGSYLVDLRSRLGYRPEDGRISAPFAAQIYAAGASTGNNDWRFGLTIPITPNERDDAGMILLQAAGTVTQMMFEWQAAYGPTHDFPIVTTGNATASFVGGVKMYLETFTVPSEGQSQAQLNTVHQTIERVDPISFVGDNTVKYLLQNTYTRLIHSVEINGLLNTDAVDRLILRYNLTDVPYDEDRPIQLYLDRRRYTRDMPKGVFVRELLDQGYPNFGGDRDLIQAKDLAALETILTIASGTVLGSNNNQIRTIQQQFVELGTPPAQPM